MKKLVIIAIAFALIEEQRICAQDFERDQISVEKIFSTVLNDAAVSKEVLTTNSSGEMTVYVDVNGLIVTTIPNYDSIYRNISRPPYQTGHFMKTDNGFIDFFLSPDLMDAAGKYKIAKVVVFDKFSIKSQSAVVIFHTTNLNSKRWNKGLKESLGKYHKYFCYLSKDGLEWKIDKMVVKDYPLKSLY